MAKYYIEMKETRRNMMSDALLSLYRKKGPESEEARQMGLKLWDFDLKEKRMEITSDELLWSSIFVTLMANKIGGLQFGIYRNCQISSRVFHTAVAALPLTKANRSDFE